MMVEPRFRFTRYLDNWCLVHNAARQTGQMTARITVIAANVWPSGKGPDGGLPLPEPVSVAA